MALVVPALADVVDDAEPVVRAAAAELVTVDAVDVDEAAVVVVFGGSKGS